LWGFSIFLLKLNNMEEKIRFPAVAGQFYPGEEKELSQMVDEFLKNVKVPKIEEEIFGVLVPHAGYVFSGFVAAHGYKVISGKDFDTVVLIGDSHYEYFDGVSVWDRGEWETPFGRVKVDEELAKEILSFSKRFFVKDSVHLFEHSLEVQIPFLQKVLKNFRILPLIFGSEDEDWKDLGKAILKLMEKKKILVVASSDLSHYPPYEMAQKVDKITIEGILSSDPEKFKEKIRNLEKLFQDIETFACAQDTIKTILEISKNLKGKAKLLKYQNSGDTIYGEKSQVVGYSAIAFFK
jgi:AmmeMemoRadiSam system protein B